MRRYFAATIAAALAAGFAMFAPYTLLAVGDESLGNQLLEGLPAGGPAPVSPADVQGPETDLELVPRSPPGDTGEPSLPPRPLRFDDVGSPQGGRPSGPLRLVRAGQGMVEAEALLRDPATLARAGEAQRQVVAHLDALIEELSKQCNGSCNNAGDKPPAPSQRSQPKPAKSAGKSGRGNTAARDSSTQLTNRAAAPIDKAELDELVKHLWGHLPPREREQMLQSFSDEFLPKYELEIEKYYERLSEEEGRLPP